LDSFCSGTKPGALTACTATLCELEDYQPPKLNQDSSVLRSVLPKKESFYSSNSVSLDCIYSPQNYYNARLTLNDSSFSLASLKLADVCDSFSGEFSFITKLLTIYDIDVDSTKHRALLELNNAGLFVLVFAQSNANNAPFVSSEYNRDDWGNGWSDDDGDCQDTRAEVLEDFNLENQQFCVASTGLWLDPYTQFEYYNASDLDVDHVVPLKYAHDHGGANWSSALKKQFYNDMENLLPVSASQNRSKGSKGPSEWMPDNINYHCQYVDSFLYVVDKYDLDVSDSERSSISAQCYEAYEIFNIF